MKGAYLGPDFTPDEIQTYLDSVGAEYRCAEPDELIERTAEILTEGSVVGWFSGRMEFGPRALGARSILGDPRNPGDAVADEHQDQVPGGVPALRAERAAGEGGRLVRAGRRLALHAAGGAGAQPTAGSRRRTEEEGRWGIEKLKVRRSEIPAVTHVDYSARVQTVSRDVNPAYYDLIAAFEERTGCPVLINTSFNVRGEPIVCTPGGRLPLLHADQHRLSGAVAVHPRQEGAAGVAGGGRLAQGSPARLSPGEGRKFAFTLAAAFGVLAGVAWWRGAPDAPPWCSARSAGAFAFGGLLVPGKLGPV